jgi:outer membrane receptor for ferrienterochelin and colicin
MRVRTLWTALGCALLLALPVFSQGNPTGKLTGRVTNDGQALPGVSVTATSPALQGTRTTVTSSNGDYNFPSLPPGEYTITFELAGLETVTQTVRMSAAQTTQLDAAMSISGLSEEIVVTGNLETISQGSQAAATYTKTLVDELPVGRTVSEIVNLAPGVSATGPGKSAETGIASITISGAASFENLFLVNGVVINENLRGQANDLFIEDAIQETTTATAGVSAEYGRFSGGVVNVITKSGGNNFDGSFRTSFTNQDWESETPFGENKTDDIIPTYEATLGGPILRDRFWFFGAGRDFETNNTDSTRFTNVSFQTGRDEQRIEGKLTLSLTPSHTFLGSYIDLEESQAGNFFGIIMDTRSLNNRETPEQLRAINYTGILTQNLFVSAQYSERDFTFVNAGSTFTDIINGTLMLDRSRSNARYWSPTFCGVCLPEERNNENALIKGSYFLSTESLGTHDLVAGYDTFTDIRAADNHQSGSDYRILGTSAVLRGTDIFPRLLGDGSTIIQYNPIFESTRGTDFVTNSIFFNDSWRFNDRLSFNLGVRYDENDGKDAAGQSVAKDDSISPRLAATFDPQANGNWVINASYGQYVAALANSVGDSTSSAGQPATFQWSYRGPAINSDPNAANLLTTDQALAILFNWFNSVGGPNNRTFLTLESIPGSNVQIRGSLNSPNVQEYAVGISKQLGGRGVFRADLVHRDFAEFYAQRTDASTGQVLTPTGARTDLTLLINNDDLYERTYNGLQTQFRYRLNDRLDLGGNYTLSQLKGNFDGETRDNGPVTAALQSYPEYKDARWNFPEGDLSADQRHKLNIYGVFRIFSTDNHSLNVSLLQQYLSGLPYGAIGTVRSVGFVTNPGYVTPPARVTYYFTARDEFRTDDVLRTDLSFNYAFKFRGVELFLQPELLNIFNGDAFDTTDTRFLDQSVVSFDTGGTCRNASATGGAGPCRNFNPFTETPVEGVHWQKGPNFGNPINQNGYQRPRTYRFSVGVRF